jgi:sialic acid synthase SpsE
VAARPIKKGEILTPDALIAKRPGCGLSPMTIWDIVGRPARRNYQKNEAIEL